MYRFVSATGIDRRSLRRHLRAVAPEAFESVEVRGIQETGERLPVAVGVAVFDVTPGHAESFRNETLEYLGGLGDRKGKEIFDGNGLYFEREEIAAATFFVSLEPVLLVHVVGQPPVDIEALAREIHAANT